MMWLFWITLAGGYLTTIILGLRGLARFLSVERARLRLLCQLLLLLHCLLLRGLKRLLRLRRLLLRRLSRLRLLLRLGLRLLDLLAERLCLRFELLALLLGRSDRRVVPALNLGAGGDIGLQLALILIEL